jgi:peptide/nickel transport system substrate-binding protein
MLTRRSVLRSAALATTTLAMPFARRAAAETTKVTPKGHLTLAWHTNIASRWLDPQQHDGTATPDNFLNALHDALTKNFREQKYDHLALADHFEFAEDAKSATLRLRRGIKFHDGSAVTPEDIRWSYEHYHGAWAKVLHDKTHAIDIVGNDTIKFQFSEPFLDFPILMGTSNICGAGWVVPAKYYQKVGADGFLQKPIGAGPYRLVAQEPGTKLEFEAFRDYYRPVHIDKLTIIGVPEAATRVAMLEREEADIMYLVPGELIDRIKSNPKLMLAPVVSANWWLEFPGFENPKNPFHDKRVREAVSLAIDRKAISDAEMGGLGAIEGNWIPEDWPGALKRPAPPTDVPKARLRLAQAAAWASSTATGSTTMSNTACRGRTGSTMSPRPRSCSPRPAIPAASRSIG